MGTFDVLDLPFDLSLQKSIQYFYLLHIVVSFRVFFFFFFVFFFFLLCPFTQKKRRGKRERKIKEKRKRTRYTNFVSLLTIVNLGTGYETLEISKARTMQSQ